MAPPSLLPAVFSAVDSVKCHSNFFSHASKGCDVMKLMINDNMSTWQKGNHGDTGV